MWWDWWISSTRELGPWEPSLPTNDVCPQKNLFPTPKKFQTKKLFPTNDVCPPKNSHPKNACPTKKFSLTNDVYQTNPVFPPKNNSPNKNMFLEGCKEFHISSFRCSWEVLCYSLCFNLILYFLWNFLCLHGDNIWSNLGVECFLEHFWSKTLFWEIITYGTVLPVQISNCTNYPIKFCPCSMAS